MIKIEGNVLHLFDENKKHQYPILTIRWQTVRSALLVLKLRGMITPYDIVNDPCHIGLRTQNIS